MKLRHDMKLLYLDIETTPNEGTFWNQWPKYIPIDQMHTPTEVLSYAFKWEGSRETTFLKWDDKDFIETIWNALDEADAVVHYNGTAFDIKHLNAAFASKGLGPPSFFHQIDLLKTVRKNFKLFSYKLDYVCRYFELGKKVKHAGIELWYGCMAGDERDWKIMEKYNRKDCVLLPKLYKFLLPWIHNHPNVGMYIEDPTKPVCTKCGSTNVVKKGTQYNTKSASYDRYRCNACGENMRSRLRSKPTSENVLMRT